jgi:hypothetical protein
MPKLTRRQLAKLEKMAREWSESPEAQKAFEELEKQIRSAHEEIGRISNIDPTLRLRPMTI